MIALFFLFVFLSVAAKSETCRSGTGICRAGPSCAANTNETSVLGADTCSSGICCANITCPTYTLMNGVQTNASYNIYGTYRFFTCNGMRVLEGVGWTMCQSNGQWSNTGQLCTLYCPAPLSGNWSYLTISKTTAYAPKYLANTMFKGVMCDVGYGVNGTGRVNYSSITCGATSQSWQWTGTPYTLPGVCTLVVCPTFNPANANITGTCGTAFGTSCNFTCQAGFTLLGASSYGTATCDYNGWSYGAVCQRDCGAFPLPSDAQLVGSCSTSYGSVCSFICPTGYDMIIPSIGSGPRPAGTVSNGSCLSLTDPNWDLTYLGYCVPNIGCGPAIPAAHTAFSTASAANTRCTVNGTVGTVCTTPCVSSWSYWLTGSANIYFDNYASMKTGTGITTCQANGTWSNPGYCTAITCNDPDTAPGYFAVGAHFFTMPNCTSFPVGNGTACQIGCNAGATASNPNANIICGQRNTMFFDNTNPIPSGFQTCTAKVCSSAHLTNGVAPASSVSASGAITAQITCNTGYSTNGVTINATCSVATSGFWEQISGPTCQIDCGAAPNLGAGSGGVYLPTVHGTTYGTTLNISCPSPSYQYAGPSSTTCLSNGSWSYAADCAGPCSSQFQYQYSNNGSCNNLTSISSREYRESAHNFVRAAPAGSGSGFMDSTSIEAFMNTYFLNTTYSQVSSPQSVFALAALQFLLLDVASLSDGKNAESGWIDASPVYGLTSAAKTAVKDTAHPGLLNRTAVLAKFSSQSVEIKAFVGFLVRYHNQFFRHLEVFVCGQSPVTDGYTHCGWSASVNQSNFDSTGFEMARFSVTRFLHHMAGVLRSSVFDVMTGSYADLSHGYYGSNPDDLWYSLHVTQATSSVLFELALNLFTLVVPDLSTISTNTAMWADCNNTYVNNTAMMDSEANQILLTLKTNTLKWGSRVATSQADAVRALLQKSSDMDLPTYGAVLTALSISTASIPSSTLTKPFVVGAWLDQVRPSPIRSSGLSFDNYYVSTMPLAVLQLTVAALYQISREDAHRPCANDMSTSCFSAANIFTNNVEYNDYARDDPLLGIAANSAHLTCGNVVGGICAANSLNAYRTLIGHKNNDLYFPGLYIDQFSQSESTSYDGRDNLRMQYTLGQVLFQDANNVAGSHPQHSSVLLYQTPYYTGFYTATDTDYTMSTSSCNVFNSVDARQLNSYLGTWY